MTHLILNEKGNEVTLLEYYKKTFIFYSHLIYLLVINNFTSDEFRYKYLCYMLQLGGPIFIKIGQNIANKKDIDPILKRNLIKLQQNNYYEETKDPKTLEIKYGLDSINEKPIASGSIATIFKGVYKKKECIIKATHNDIVKNTIISINLFEGLRNRLIGNNLLSGFNQLVELKQIYKEVMDQSDLRNEVNNLKTIKNNFSNKSFSNLIIFPEIYHYDKDVIIESYEYGYDIFDFIKKYPDHKEEASHLIHCIFYKMFFDNCIHADMHFSNVRFRYEDSKVKVVLYDFGLVSRIDSQDDYKMFINVYKKNMFIPDKSKFIDMLINLNINKDADLEKFSNDCQEFINESKMDNLLENLNEGTYNKEKDYNSSVSDIIQKGLDLALSNNLKINDYVFNICNGFILLDDYNVQISDNNSLLKQRLTYAKENGFIEDMKKNASNIFNKKKEDKNLNNSHNYSKENICSLKEKINIINKKKDKDNIIDNKIETVKTSIYA